METDRHLCRQGAATTSDQRKLGLRVSLRDRGRNYERRAEGILSIAVMGVLFTALALIYHAPLRLPAPPNALLLNAATAGQLATGLDIDPALAQRILAVRQQRGGFTSVDQLLDIHLFDRTEAERLAGALHGAKPDWHTAAGAQFARTLGIARPIGERLAGWRDAEWPPATQEVSPTAPSPGSAGSPPATAEKMPTNADSFLRHAMLLDPQTAHPLLNRFLIRTPAEAAHRLLIDSALLLLGVLVLPIWVRNGLRVGGDPFLLPLALLLSGLGAVMLYSVKDPLRDALAYDHHLKGLVVSLVAFLACSRLKPLPRSRIKNYQYLWVMGAALLVLMLFIFGRGPEGVKLNLLGFQPVELIKLMLVFFLAGYLADRADLITDASRPFASGWDKGGQEASRRRGLVLKLPRRQDLGPVAVLFGLALTLFYVIKDLGPGLLVFSTFIVLLYITTGRGSFLSIGLVLLIVGGLLGYWRHIGVFATRVDMWLSPFANRHANGMQLGQAYWALASGGWSGSGLGLGMPNLIPRGQDDLAFISWTEETGLAGAGLMLVVYSALIWRGIRIAVRSGNDFDRALAFGLTALLGLQTLLILCGDLGLLPLTGISLPFASYGDSALVAAWIVVGLLRGISAPRAGGLEAGGMDRVGIRPEVGRAAFRFALAMLLLLAAPIGLYRLPQTMLWSADPIALRPVTTPDADGVLRPHANPRLLVMAAAIQRGSIYDRNGRVLATSRPAEIAKIEPNPKHRAALYGSHTRIYPFGPATAHLVGTMNTAIGGPSGFERYYNAQLRGYARLEDLLADYRARNSPFYIPRRGRDLHLTIDAPLQRDVQEMLRRATARLKDQRNGHTKHRAAFVLLDPHTGDVVVAATMPTFDPNTLTAEKYRKAMAVTDPEDDRPFINRAVAGYYPPGSTLKIATTACALDRLPDAMNFSVACNIVDPNLRWEVDGKRYARIIHDDKGDPAFGNLTLADAFRVSSNIYFANLAVALGIEKLHGALADQMEFSHTPRPEHMAADLADVGYGQGLMLASPLEMARLAGAVANNGAMMRPRYVTSMTDPAGRDKESPVAPAVLSQAMSPAAAATLRTLMRTVVTGGTARGVFETIAVPVGGKTGTAQNRQMDRQPHSWFVGLAPADDQPGGAPPRYVFACIVENGGYGKTVAAVVCRDVLRKLF
jgi:cell division protein FtsI/penicillin-binding protein 2/cell division protein FtsW (lipid II flippase)